MWICDSQMKTYVYEHSVKCGDKPFEVTYDHNHFYIYNDDVRHHYIFDGNVYIDEVLKEDVIDDSYIVKLKIVGEIERIRELRE